MTALAILGRYLWSFLSFGITLPIWMFFAAWLFLQWDKSQAVKDAVAELVASEQLNAARAQIAEERRLRVFQEGKANALATANRNFEQRTVIAQLETEKLADELEDIKSHPAPDGCTVDQLLLDRVRK